MLNITRRLDTKRNHKKQRLLFKIIIQGSVCEWFIHIYTFLIKTHLCLHIKYCKTI